MMEEDILEALESSAPASGDKGGIGDPRVSSNRDVALWKKAVLRFINELEDDITVGDIRRALEG